MGENLSTREVIEELNRQENKSAKRNAAAGEQDGEDRPKFKGKVWIKRRVCQFCMEKYEKKRPLYIDYKDSRLKKYIAENGKILPRRQTGLCAAHQRELTKAVKTAKNIGLL
jgi:small subunit ribosomal protein S18